MVRHRPRRAPVSCGAQLATPDLRTLGRWPPCPARRRCRVPAAPSRSHCTAAACGVQAQRAAVLGLLQRGHLVRFVTPSACRRRAAVLCGAHRGVWCAQDVLDGHRRRPRYSERRELAGGLHRHARVACMLKLRLRLRLRVCLCLCLFVTQGHLISYSAIQAGGAWLARVLHTFVGLMLSPPSSRVFSRCRPRVLPEPGPRHHLHRLRQGERLRVVCLGLGLCLCGCMHGVHVLSHAWIVGLVHVLTVCDGAVCTGCEPRQRPRVHPAVQLPPRVPDPLVRVSE